MQQRAFDNERIDFMWNSVVEEYLGDSALAGLRIRDTVTSETSVLDVTGCFIAVGPPAQHGPLRGTSWR